MRKNKLTLKVAAVLLSLSTLSLQLSTLFAQGTAFTYQGRLTDSGSPANGRYDFIFLVFDAPSAGTSLGGSVNTNGVGVSNGLFTVMLDFGSSPFTGPQRWLQISVSTNGAGSFVTLAPRQEITRAPYANYANTAATVTNGAIANAQLALNAVGSANIQSNAVSAGQIVSGQVVKSLNGLTDGVSLTQGANVTINTVGNSLQISAPAGGMALPFSGSASSSGSIFTLANSGTGPAGVFLGNLGVGNSNPQYPLDVAGAVRLTRLGDGAEILNLSTERSWAFRQLHSGSFTALELASVGGGGNKNFIINTAGFVGVGTTDPGAKLDVRGDIRLGANGQFHAASSEENLRIVRGVINGDGSVLHGVGFSSSNPQDGHYRISFTTPFAGTPSVTATVMEEGSIASAFSMTREESSSGVVIQVILRSSGSFATRPLQFIAVGPR